MMWVSFAMERNKQYGKRLAELRNAWNLQGQKKNHPKDPFDKDLFDKC